jgi:hypothetical protein
VHPAERLEPRLGEPRLRERLTKLGTLAERGEDFPRRAGVEDRDPARDEDADVQVQRLRREPLVETIMCGGESHRVSVEVIGAKEHSLTPLLSVGSCCYFYGASSDLAAARR